MSDTLPQALPQKSPSQTGIPRPVMPEQVEQIRVIGMSRLPHEACGLILPDGSVVEVPNTSSEPHDNFVMTAQDMVNTMQHYMETRGIDFVPRQDVIIWHTHPSGFLGPSELDMRHKVPGCRHLVVALPEGLAARY